MVHAIHDGGVLVGPDPKRRNLNDPICARIILEIAGRVLGGTGFYAVGVYAVDTRKRAELVVKRVVLVEYYKNILDFFPQQGLNILLRKFGVLGRIYKISLNVAPGIGLCSDGRHRRPGSTPGLDKSHCNGKKYFLKIVYDNLLNLRRLLELKPRQSGARRSLCVL